MPRLYGKAAAVTGAANGLGAAIARRFLDEGASVAVLDRDPNGEQLAKEFGGRARFWRCDVTSEQEVSDTLNAVADEFGRIDVLVNNAGVEGTNKPTDQFDLDEWNRVMAVNCTAVFLCTKHVIRHLRATGAGSIINISSIYGLLGGGDIPPYHASKGAVRLMAKNDALTYAPENIRVNSIRPGFILTDMVHRYADEAGLSENEAREVLNPLHPLGGTGRPDDIAWGAVFLASDEARWITGSELVIDGGYSAR